MYLPIACQETADTVKIAITITQVLTEADPKEVEVKHPQEDAAVLREALVLLEEVKVVSQLLVQEVERRKVLLLHGLITVIMRVDMIISLEMERSMAIINIFPVLSGGQPIPKNNDFIRQSIHKFVTITQARATQHAKFSYQFSPFNQQDQIHTSNLFLKHARPAMYPINPALIDRSTIVN